MEGAKQPVTTEERGRMQQLVAAVIANLAALTYGTMVGWQSPMTPQLQSANPPVGSEPMSDEAASWLNGTICVGAFFGTILFGFIAEKFGRKIAGCAIALPFGLCWLLTIFAPTSEYLFAGRFFAGMGGAGTFVTVPLYVAEIASDGIRGTLGSLLVFFVNFGILIGYIAGTVLSFKVFAVCALAFPLVYLGAFIFMPETPIYLVRRDRTAEAARSLLWLRGGDKSSVDRELARLETNAREAAATAGTIGIEDLFRDRGTVKGVVIAMGLLSGQQFCGIFAMIGYASTIFKLAGSSLSPELASIVLGAIQLLGSFISTSLMERAGRKPLILISCAGMTVCHCVLGGFCLLQRLEYDVSAWSWLPVVALSTYVIIFGLGMGPAPFVVASEVFQPEIASLANSTCLLFMWFVAFLVVKFFATLTLAIGIDGCFFLFAGSCAFTFVFALFVVPETKGKTLETILAELNERPQRLSEKRYITIEANFKSGAPLPERV